MSKSSSQRRPTSKSSFDLQARRLQVELLKAQRHQAEAGSTLIVIVSGVETAGKGEFVKRLNEWLDARSVNSVAFWDESDEERERPAHWRYWRQLPARGTTAILFGSWYTPPIVSRALKDIRKKQLKAQLDSINALEHALSSDRARLVKLWFHISRAEQKRRLKAIAKDGKRQLTRQEKDYSRHYERFLNVSRNAMAATDRAYAPWHVIEATDRRHGELAAGRILLAALRAPVPLPAPAPLAPLVRKPPRLGCRSPGSAADPESYPGALEKLQARLNALSWQAHRRKISTVAMFEGWDAAGKGGAIRRVTAAMDARLFRVIPVAAPTDEELAHHYLWRFWRHIPRGGYVTLYDRSWYGRVLVERVEKYAAENEWRRAYAEINEFERQLTGHGVALAKFWLDISPEEQLRRFKERERLAYKQHKITEDDWRNRKKWKAYEGAVNEMMARTSTAHAPWTLVAANDKKQARLTVLKTLCERLEAALDR